MSASQEVTIATNPERTTMKLWLLRPVDGLRTFKGRPNPWYPWYNKCFGFVIRAETEKDARKIAAEDCRNEGESAWMDVRYSTCKELLPNGEAGIIIEDFSIG